MGKKITFGTAVISRRNEKQRLCKIGVGWGGGGVNKVHYGRCASGISDEANKMTFLNIEKARYTYSE